MDIKKQKRSIALRSLDRRQKDVQAELGNNFEAGFYALNITVGNPGQPVSVVLDTGSSDLWVPVTGTDICTSNTAQCDVFGSYDPEQSDSSGGTNIDFDAAYGDGTEVAGQYVSDDVAFASATVTGAILGAAATGSTSNPLTGIMGIGYVNGEAIATLDEDPADVYPNIVSQLKSQGIINTMAYSLWLNDLGKLHPNISPFHHPS